MKGVVYLLVALSLVGCRVKKKVTDRDKVKEVSVIKQQEVKQSTAFVDSLKKSSTKEVVVSSFSELEVQRGEADTLIEITERQIEGGRVLTISGAEKVSIKDAKSKTERIDTTSTKVSSREHQSQETTKEEKLTSKRNTRKTDSLGTGVSWSLVVGLAILAFLLFLYWRTRRRR